MRRIAIIESPFKGNENFSETVHRAYLERLIRYVTLELGCTPYASHKMLTDALDEGVSKERGIGMAAGIDATLQILKWHKWATGPGGSPSYMESRPRIIFGMDYGNSSGMTVAEDAYRYNGYMTLVEHVHIGKNPDNAPISCSVCGSWCCQC